MAHFLIRALAGEPISIYGNGKQVRDILHVDDAVAAYRAALASVDKISGSVFNLGGGPHNSVSILGVLREIERLTGRPLKTSFGPWRAGDQYFFIADTRKLEQELGWQARTRWRGGIRHLAEWLVEHRFGGRPILSEAKRIPA